MQKGIEFNNQQQAAVMHKNGPHRLGFGGGRSRENHLHVCQDSQTDKR